MICDERTAGPALRTENPAVSVDGMTSTVIPAVPPPPSRAERRLAAQKIALELAVGGAPIGTVLTHIARATQEQIGAESRTALFIVDEKAGCLLCAASAGMAQEYTRAGKSLAAILPTIQAPGIPEALKLDADQTMGADRYRLNLLKTFKTKGAADVENYLKQSQ